MPPAALDQVGPADDDPGLRAAEQLVAAERHDAGAGGERLHGRRFAGQPRRAARRAATGTSHRSARCRCRPRRARRARPARHRRRLDEPVDPVVARVDLEHRAPRRRRAGRSRVRSRRGGCGSSCRRRRAAHRTGRSPRGRGTTPPISTLSPRLTGTSAPGGERGEHEQHGGGVVVDHHRRFGPAQPWRTADPTAACRDPRSPVAQVELDGLRRRPAGSTASGARPRLVCSSTPVAFTTGVSRVRSILGAPAGVRRRHRDHGSPLGRCRRRSRAAVRCRQRTGAADRPMAAAGRRRLVRHQPSRSHPIDDPRRFTPGACRRRPSPRRRPSAPCRRASRPCRRRHRHPCRCRP